MKISVCIPVYNTENVLSRCLESVLNQDFSDYEIIIVNDASHFKDKKGRKCKKIIEDVLCEKKSVFGKPVPKVPFTYIEHLNNLGILETRRDAVNKAKGDYIFILDSDDFIDGKDAFQKMHDAAVEHDADIVNTLAKVYSSDPENKKNEYLIRKASISRIEYGELAGSDIIKSYLVERKHLGFLWAKLIRRSVFQKALEQIPFTLCTMAEDFIFYFFISLFSKKYFGMKESFYRYSIDEGISSRQEIRDLNRWGRVISASSVFAILSEYIEKHKDDKEFPLSEEIINAVRGTCNNFVRNNLQQLKEKVVPELQQEAYEMLCDYWGDSYVKRIENILNQTQN